MQIHLLANHAGATSVPVLAPRPWLVNQILIAEVIGATASNFTSLRIDGQNVRANSAIPLRPGQQLTLQVAALEPSVVLKVRNLASGSQTGGVNAGLARTLPRQGSLVQTLSLMRALSQREFAPAIKFDAATRSSFQQFLRALPRIDHAPSPQQLHTLVKTGALATEAKLQTLLATAQPHDPKVLTADLRTQLSRIAKQLAPTNSTHRETREPAPSTATVPTKVLATPTVSRIQAQPRIAAELTVPPAPTSAAREPLETSNHPIRELVDGALARIHTHQLANLQAVAGSNAPIVVELPILHEEQIDLWHFEFEDPDAGAPSLPHEQRTVVILKLQFDAHCSVAAELRVSGDTVSVRLDSDDSRLHQLLADRLEELGHNLAQRGIAVSSLCVGEVTAISDVATRHRGLINDNI